MWEPDLIVPAQEAPPQFWVFSLTAESRWEVDIGEHWFEPADGGRRRRRTEWHPLSGRYHNRYERQLVPIAEASSRERALAACQRRLTALEGERIAAFLPGDTHTGLEWTTSFRDVESDSEDQPVPLELSPRRVVPFRIDRDRAAALVRACLGRGIFRPGPRRMAVRGVFLPQWRVEVRWHVYWTADSDRTPSGTRAGWAPCSGSFEVRLDGGLAPASALLSSTEMLSLGEYDLGEALPYAPEILGGQAAEAITVAPPLSLAGAGDRLRQEAATRVPGTQHRSLKINPLATSVSAAPVLLPVWIVDCESSGRPCRVLVNGQTGQAEGEAPVDPWRVAIAVLLGALLIVLVLLAV